MTAFVHLTQVLEAIQCPAFKETRVYGYAQSSDLCGMCGRTRDQHAAIQAARNYVENKRPLPTSPGGD